MCESVVEGLALEDLAFVGVDWGKLKCVFVAGQWFTLDEAPDPVKKGP
jgi:hypothetical protein